MLLIADSGSTKCDWVFTDGEHRSTFHTMGFNPFFHNTELIASEIQKNEALAALGNRVRKICYYLGGDLAPGTPGAAGSGGGGN